MRECNHQCPGRLLLLQRGLRPEPDELCNSAAAGFAQQHMQVSDCPLRQAVAYPADEGEIPRPYAVRAVALGFRATF